MPNHGEPVRGVPKSANLSRGVADCGESGTGVPNYGESVRGVRKSAIFSQGVADCGESGTGVQKSSYLGR